MLGVCLMMNIYIFFGKCNPLRSSYFSAGGEGKSCWFAPVAMSYVFGLETVAPARGISICRLLQAPGAGPDFFCPSFNSLCALRSRVKKPFRALRKLLQLLGSDLGEAEHRLPET